MALSFVLIVLNGFPFNLSRKGRQLLLLAPTCSWLLAATKETHFIYLVYLLNFFPLSMSSGASQRLVRCQTPPYVASSTYIGSSCRGTPNLVTTKAGVLDQLGCRSPNPVLGVHSGVLMHLQILCEQRLPYTH